MIVSASIQAANQLNILHCSTLQFAEAAQQLESGERPSEANFRQTANF